MIGAQLYANRPGVIQAPSRERFITPRNEWVKPRGGFWTSTYEPIIGSEWIEWCVSEDFAIPEDRRWSSWLIQPAPGARIFEIDCLSDLRDLLLQFPRRTDWGQVYPDFEAVAHEYDAIHLTSAGQWDTRLSDPNLYGWDCESTLWLNWRAIGAIEWLGMREWTGSREVVEA